MNTFTTRFAGFPHDASELSAYLYSLDTFIICLKSGPVIHHETEQPILFLEWLHYHRIRDVKFTLTAAAYNKYREKMS